MEQEEQESKWEATVSRRTNASADQIWPFLQDFFGIYKWFPSLSTSYGVHGKNGEIGSIRYCKGSSIPSQRNSKNINGHGEGGSAEVSWSKERLIDIDSAEKSLCYEIVDGNIGFNSYVAAIKILPGGGTGAGDQEGCVIEWSFSVDPVAGMRFEDLVEKYELGLQSMVQQMESALGNVGN